jgi:hypothetical protein
MSTATYAHIEVDAAGVPVISGTMMKVVVAFQMSRNLDHYKNAQRQRHN